MGLLGDQFLDDPMTQLGMGLLSGNSPFFGPNLAAAYQQMQAQRDAALKRQMLMQQMEVGNLDLGQKKQAIADQEQLRQAMQAGGQDVMAGGKGIALGSPADSSKSSIFAAYSAKADQLERLGSPQAMQMAKQYRELAEKYRPEVKDTKTLTDPATGKRITVNIMKDGTQQVVPFAPDQEKAHFMDTGNGIVPVDPFTGKPVGQAIAKGISPDSLFSGNVTMRGQNLTDARARDLNAITQQGQKTQVLETPAGPVVVDRQSSTARPVTMGGAPIPGESTLKKQVNAQGVLDLLSDAKQIIPQSTNSFVGAGADLAARGVGYPTEGAQAIAKLKTIEGALLAQMPRMEGPQSNYDVQNYKQAAGMLGDPTVPRELKLSAIAEIERIQKRYAGQPIPSKIGGFKYLGKE